MYCIFRVILGRFRILKPVCVPPPRPACREVQVTYTGLKIWDLPKILSLDDTGLSVVLPYTLAGYQMAKYT